MTIVVATWGGVAEIAHTLEVLGEQARAWPHPTEVLVVANRPEEALEAGAVDAMRARCDRLIFEPQAGKSHALNTAVREARYELLAFTDDDATPAPGWLAALLAPFEEAGAERLAGTGGRLWPVFPEGGAPDWFRHLLSGRKTFFLGPWHDLGRVALDYPDATDGMPLGANCALRRSLLLEVPYPTDLGPNRATGLRGGEDTVVCLRLLELGWRLRYVPEARAYHPVDAARMDFAYVLDGFRIQGRETARIDKHLGRALKDRGRLRRRMRRHRVRAFLYGLIGHPKRLRHVLRSAWTEGLLEEHDAAPSAGSGEVRP